MLYVVAWRVVEDLLLFVVDASSGTYSDLMVDVDQNLVYLLNVSLELKHTPLCSHLAFMGVFSNRVIFPYK